MTFHVSKTPVLRALSPPKTSVRAADIRVNFEPDRPYTYIDAAYSKQVLCNHTFDGTIKRLSGCFRVLQLQNAAKLLHTPLTHQPVLTVTFAPCTGAIVESHLIYRVHDCILVLLKDPYWQYTVLLAPSRNVQA